MENNSCSTTKTECSTDKSTENCGSCGCKPGECKCAPNCKYKKCCPMQYFMSAIAAFIVIFVFERLFHGGIMMDHYKATASMWRPEADMQNYFPFILIRQIGIALVFTCIYKWFGKMAMASGCCGCPIAGGAKLGLKIGLIVGFCEFGSYAWLPFPSMEIPVMWFVGAVIMYTLMGMALGLICKMKQKKGDCK
jgi:hypothetical protein